MDDQMIPIDIQCNKLVDWLIDRRHCSIRWQTAAKVVKDKISAALLDMPSTKEMQQLLEGSCFHYFKCLKIVDVLKDTEKDSKNFFGMYASKRMKDWKEIVKLYEKDNLHLAELSNRLLRNVNYEIPAIKRQITKCGQVHDECLKKIQDCDRSVVSVEKKFLEECKKFGVKGDDIRKELLERVQELPHDLDVIGSKCKDLLPVVEYYAAFVDFSLSSDKFTDEITPMIKHICAHGNSTVYQWKHGVIPDKVLKRELQSTLPESMTTNADEIDWGDSENVTSVPDDAIDFDIDVSDLGIELETSGDVDNVVSDSGYEIIEEKDGNWEIEEVSMSEVPNGKKMMADEKVADGEEALSVLEYCSTRTQFINELIELIAFLSQRLAEAQREDDMLAMNQFQSAPPILQLTSISELQSMFEAVSSIHGSLTSNKMRQLYRILDSPKYVDRITENLKRQRSSKQKYERLKAAHHEAIKNSQNEEKSLHPRVQFLVAETKEWQKLIEAEISKRYKNRPFYILGSINLL